MASVFVLLGCCIYTTVKSHVEERQEQKLRDAVAAHSPSRADGPADDPAENRKATKKKEGRWYSRMGLRQRHSHRRRGEVAEGGQCEVQEGQGGMPSMLQVGDPVTVERGGTVPVPADDASGSTTLWGSEDGGVVVGRR